MATRTGSPSVGIEIEGIEGDQGARQQRSGRDRAAQDGTRGPEPALDPDLRIRGQRRVDEPRFEGTAVEGAVHPLEGRDKHEHRHGIRGEQDDERYGADQPGQDEDGPTPERVGQPAGRQFEQQDDESLHAEDKTDLGQ